jgi:hypothetical protein
MGFVYAFRYGSEDVFKFGKATNVEQRRKELQTGCPQPLSTFDSIETGDHWDGESFIHRRLAGKRRSGEYFAVTEDEASAAMKACRFFLDDELPRLKEQRAKVDELSALENGPEMLPASEDVVSKYRELIRLQAEMQRIGAEQERLVLEIKLAIGASKGIDGVATWETCNHSHFDQTRFKAEHPDEHASYMETTRSRRFILKPG